MVRAEEKAHYHLFGAEGSAACSKGLEEGAAFRHLLVWLDNYSVLWFLNSPMCTRAYPTCRVVVLICIEA